MTGKKARLLTLVAALGVGLAVTASGSARPDSHPNGGTLVFAGARDPVVLDPAVVSDGESLRPIRQIYEGLMTVKTGTANVVPQLATAYSASKDGRTWTFQLRKGVRFHDGTAFNAQAVCFNFNRWYSFRGAFQLDNGAYYWRTIFGNFRHPEAGSTSEGLYRGCKALKNGSVRIFLNKRSGSFLGALALPSFSIASPKALQQYGADEARVEAGSFRATGSYGFEHPTGTGPYRFEAWERGNRLVLVRNTRYWGKKAHLERIIFRPIANNAARLQALQSGDVQGYDFVDPADMGTVKSNSRLQLLSRPMFNIAYVAINQKKPPMDNILVRRAIAHGMDRQSVVNSFYAGTGQVAHAFMPPTLFGYAKDVPKYNYDPDRAKSLLRQAGLSLPVKIEFWYPTGVSRPYMPDPKRNFEGFAASLERSGFEVVARSAPWSPDYLGAVQNGRGGHLHLLGWTGDYADPDNFLGTFFQRPKDEWGFNNPTIHNLLDRAEAEVDAKKRTALYQQANREIMKFLPGVPYAHSRPALGFERRVKNYVPSPVSLEPFRLVFFSGGT